jgi:hypothetical protein
LPAAVDRSQQPEKIAHLRRGPIDVDLAARWERGQDPS